MLPVMRIHSPALRYFDAVREAGSIREAARRLNVASSAVNRQILKLEAEIGSPLFERLPSGLKLSAAGEALTRHVTIVLKDAERTRAELDSLRGVHSGRVEMMSVEAANFDLLPKVIDRMAQHHKRVRIKVVTAGSRSVPDALINGEVDLGLAFSLPRNPQLQQLAVGRFHLGAIVAADHPLAGRKRTRISDCADYPLIVSDPQLSLRPIIHSLIMQSGRPITPMIEANSIELMKRLAEMKVGVAFASRIGLEAELLRGSLVHIPLEDRGPVYTELALYTRANAGMTVAVAAFAQFVGAEIMRRALAEEDALKS